MDEKTIVYAQTKINKNFIKCKKISKFAADCAVGRRAFSAACFWNFKILKAKQL